MKNKVNAEELLEKYHNGTTTAEEQLLVQNWFIGQNASALPDAAHLLEDHFMIRNALLQHVRPSVKYKIWRRIGVAAAVLGLAIGIYFYNNSWSGDWKQKQDNLVYKNDIAPGKNRATLSVNGRSIQLSDAMTGVIIDADQITYDDGTQDPSLAKALSLQGGERSVTVVTPRGGTYQVRLPDGTKVWLNAATTVTYTMPLKERGGIRKVELSGEAYFEVFKNKLQPFVVNSKKMDLTVLGTHFNVSAYEDELGSRATLLEGSVRVSSALPTGTSPQGGERMAITLKPNQEASVTGGPDIKIRAADPEEALAWKSGYFKFENEEIHSIMRKVSRWYNVEVKYEPGVSGKGLTGTISRFQNVSKILEMLQATRLVRFKVEGKTIIVMKS